ncbi:MAG: hypothetical protein KF798_01890 [Candidatus Paracaedibacteraceae bacterium]|nr:hypothetical protein [Candidatus Paracaedibacteraceae bacterium]
MDIQFDLFYIDRLSVFMLILINYVFLFVGSFAKTYLAGDASYRPFFRYFPVLVISLNILVISDNVLLFLVAWGMSNIFLGLLMGYRSQWTAARASVILAYKTFAVGWFFLAGAFVLLSWNTGTMSIQKLLTLPHLSTVTIFAMVLIFCTAMTQSALWPFHKWLTSSLNSPTPASAMMHAGLVNGGGFLLARMAPLYVGHDSILTVMFVVGLVTAVVGTLWKLVQSDYKRMLACSTMGQMGFMIAQCGLGLFPAAVAHLCWHGLYKAYMFLGSGSAPQEKRYDLHYPITLRELGYASLFGLWGGFLFTLIAYGNLDKLDTRLILICVAMMAGTQLVLPIIRQPASASWIRGFVVVSFFACLYGLSVGGVELILEPLDLSQPYDLNVLHWVGLAVLCFSWLGLLFHKSPVNLSTYPKILQKLYVMALNGGQPHKSTITTHKKDYTDR